MARGPTTEVAMRRGAGLSALFCLLGAALAKEGLWTCNGQDGYWYENGVRSTYSGCSSDGKGDATSATESGKGSSTELTEAEKVDSTCSNGARAASSGTTSTYACGIVDENGHTGKTAGTGSSGSGSNGGSSTGNFGWTCSNGVWVDPAGAASSYNCTGDGSKSLSDPDYGVKADSGGASIANHGCTVTTMRGSMPGTERHCILHPSYESGRCWWTYVPSSVQSITNGRLVPLVVDMHGGGGCARDQMMGSGFKQIADTDSDGLVVVWPQGGLGGLWASSGTSSRISSERASGKDLPQWDDIGFLEQLIANVIRNSTHGSKIDPERVYVTGFSLGCMMAHRFALERSRLVAGIGCQGGELSLYPRTTAEMDAEKTTYAVQPMPVYISIGTADVWRPGAIQSFEAWKYWNQCSTNTTTVTGIHTVEEASSCTSYTPSLLTRMLDISGGCHCHDSTAMQMAYDFLKQYRRAGVRLTSVPAPAPPAIYVVPSASTEPVVSPSPTPAPIQQATASEASQMSAGFVGVVLALQSVLLISQMG